MSSLEDATWLYGALSTGIVHMEQQRLICVAMMVSNVCGRDSLGSGQEVTQWMLGVSGKAAGAAAEEEGAAAEAAGAEVRSCAMIRLRIALKRVGATVTQGQNLYPKLYRQNMNGAICAGVLIPSHAPRSAMNHLLQIKGPSYLRQGEPPKTSKVRAEEQERGPREVRRGDLWCSSS